MTTKVTKIKALLGLSGTSDSDVLKQLNAAHDGMNGNPAFSAPPGDMQTFKAGIDKFTVLVTDAEDGGSNARRELRLPDSRAGTARLHRLECFDQLHLRLVFRRMKRLGSGL